MYLHLLSGFVSTLAKWKRKRTIQLVTQNTCRKMNVIFHLHASHSRRHNVHKHTQFIYIWWGRDELPLIASHAMLTSITCYEILFFSLFIFRSLSLCVTERKRDDQWRIYTAMLQNSSLVWQDGIVCSSLEIGMSLCSTDSWFLCKKCNAKST